MISEVGWSHGQLARAFVRVALEAGADEYATVGRSHVSHWVAGSRPSGRAPQILCEALSRRLNRTVTLEEVGLADDIAPTLPLDWRLDTLAALAILERTNVDAHRRRILTATTYSVAALALPDESWWTEMTARYRHRNATGTVRVASTDVDVVRDMTSMLSRIDQRRGGGHARSAVAHYLTTDVSDYLRGRFPTNAVRRKMFSAAGELAYLAGWMAFDNAEQATAQRYFSIAVQLAAEADDPPLAGHVLRAMAHQAVDLGHPRQAAELAAASMSGKRYQQACHRERALIGVVYARTLASTAQRKAAAAELVRAEHELSQAGTGVDEPDRVFFFGEASLAHQTACALSDSDDLAGALREFQRSVRTRQAGTFTRTHAVTLGHLGSVQFRLNHLEEAYTTWSRALDVMGGVRSGRTRQVAATIRATLSAMRGRDVPAIASLDRRAAAYLAATA